MGNSDDEGIRAAIVSRATEMARSGRFARCIDIEAALIPHYGYQAMRSDFRSPAFQNDIERICRESFRRPSDDLNM